MKIDQLHQMLTEGLKAQRMSPTPFQGGLMRGPSKHAAGHKGQTYKKRHGGTKRRRTQPHPSTVAARDLQHDQAA